MKMRSIITSFVLVILTLGLSACTKPQIDLAVASQPNVNPDHSGRPSPVIMKMYELRGDLAFKQAEFQVLFEKPMQALGADLIAADELVFVPGEARTVSYMPAPETKFIGLVGGFRQMDRSVWRVVKSINAEEKELIGIELNDASILVVPSDKLSDWTPEEAVKRYQQQLMPAPAQNVKGGQSPIIHNNTQYNHYQTQQFSNQNQTANLSPEPQHSLGTSQTNIAPNQNIPANNAVSPQSTNSFEELSATVQKIQQVPLSPATQLPTSSNSQLSSVPIQANPQNPATQGYVLPSAKKIGVK